MYYRNVVQRLEKAAPFLSYDSDPYPVVTNGRLYWVVDAYTTTDNFPYSQQANTDRLSSASGLANQSFNYVRNSVKAVVNAYTGDHVVLRPGPERPNNPNVQRAFPKLFTPMSKANSIIPGHHQPLALSRGHIHRPDQHVPELPPDKTQAVFYTNSQAWSIAQNPSSGEVNAATTTLPALPGARRARTAAPPNRASCRTTS